MKLPALRPLSTAPQSCKICGGAAPLFGVVDFNKHCVTPGHALQLPLSGVPIYYRQCASCDFLYTDAFDDWSIEDFRAHIYNDEYALADPEYALKRPRDNADFVEQFWGELRTTCRLLDFGGGNDAMCATLREKGFTTAVSYDPIVPEFAQRPDGKFETEIVKKVFSNYGDNYAKDHYDKYINDGIGISITYSKTVGNYAGCIAPSNDSIEYEQQFISTPVKLIADTSEHKIFVASGYYDVMGEGTDQSIHAEVNVSCKTNTTNLGAIINPTTVDTNTIADVFDVEFDYGTVATTADLDTFAKNLLPDSIVIDKTQQPTKNGKVYQYYFTTSGQKTLGDPSPNWFNLLYDPTKHLALFWMTPDTQFPVWQDISSSGKSITLNPPVGNIIAN